MTSALTPSALAFELPQDRVATQPPEARGVRRDGVRLLVARPDGFTHTRFSEIGAHLEAGDVLVVNQSRTMEAALPAARMGRALVVHLSTPLDDGSWIIELRRPDQTGPVRNGQVGEVIELPGGATATLLAPCDVSAAGEVRLWRAALTLPRPAGGYLSRHGHPIRYSYVPDAWPIRMYQTVFARRSPDFASAEMASAGRPFTRSLAHRLRRRGIDITPITLHAGVSSLEASEPPGRERFAVPPGTAARVNRAKREGRRVIAVGTGATRALESVGRPDGTVRSGYGWTDLIITPSRPTAVVDGLVTGWHPPGASHLSLLRAVAGPDLVEAAYRTALQGDYLWHEFGDSCLLLGDHWL